MLGPVLKGVPLVLVATLAACGGPATTVAPPAASSGVPSVPAATDRPSLAPPASTGATDPYGFPDAEWSGGVLHLEVTGGFEGTLDLPLRSGETLSGRTTFVFENHDDDNEFSIGLVRLSFFPQADSIGVEAGGLTAIGPCAIVFDQVALDMLTGTLECEDDLQAQVQGDPREIRITGSFTGAT